MYVCITHMCCGSVDDKMLSGAFNKGNQCKISMGTFCIVNFKLHSFCTGYR